MTRVSFESVELYPVRSARRDPYWYDHVFDVPDEALERWDRAAAEFDAAQREIRDIVDPPCPECGHRTSRHQEWSPRWNHWGCLDHCKCQYGIPEGRKETK